MTATASPAARAAARSTMSVIEIQKALIARGYDLGPSGADGDAGPKTIAAVAAFQREHGLVAEGIAGPHTQTALLDTFDLRDLKNEPAMPAWLALARAELGTHEGVGQSNNPRVIAYFRDAGFPGIKDDATAWCAGFAGAMLHRAGIEPSHSLAARSYEHWGVGLKEPALGCIVTKKRGTGYQGHVFFCVGANKTQILGLGGNQSDAVTVAAFKRDSSITSFRWPAGIPLPVRTKLPTTVAGAKEGVSEA